MKEISWRGHAADKETNTVNKFKVSTYKVNNCQQLKGMTVIGGGWRRRRKKRRAKRCLNFCRNMVKVGHILGKG